MRDYEVVYIFKSALGTEDIDARLQRYHEKILAAEGSEITAVEHWGKRQLAYQIDRNENGYYVVAQFSTEPGALPEFERLLKLDDEVLRHLVVLSEGELAVPISLGDDDEDDDRRRGKRADADSDDTAADDAGSDDDDDEDDDSDDTAADDAGSDDDDDEDDDSDDTDDDDDDDDDDSDDEEKADVAVVDVEEDDSGADGDEDTDEEDKD